MALDTSVFIYQLEANERYVSLTDVVFAWIERPGHAAVISTITMTELLVPYYRDKDESRVDEFYGLLTTYPNLLWLAPNLQTADIAARLRATYNLRTPDALQAASAVHANATAMITNDPAIARVPEFETAILDRFL